MALSVKVGSFALPASTTNPYTVTVGFQPKVVLFFANDCTADGSVVNLSHMYGMATSSTARACAHGISLDNQGTSAASRYFSTNECIAYVNTSESKIVSVDFVQFTATGFELNCATVDGTQHIINYLALGGTDVTNAKVGNWTTPTVTGNDTTTGVGFQPDLVIAFMTGSAAGTASASSNIALGAFTANEQWTTTNRSRDARPAADVQSYQRTDQALASTLSTAGSKTVEAAFSSFNNDGFVLNYSTVYTSGLAFAYLAIKGPQFKLGSLAQPTSTGDQTQSSIGFTPVGLVLAGFNGEASTSLVTTRNRGSFGATDGTTQGCIWYGDTDGADPSAADQNLDRTKLLKHMTEGTPTTDASCTFSSFSSGQFVINWGAADATARQFLWLAIGAAVASGTPYDGDSTFSGTSAYATESTQGHAATDTFSATAAYTPDSKTDYGSGNTFSGTAAYTPVATANRPADSIFAATAGYTPTASRGSPVDTPMSATAGFSASSAIAQLVGTTLTATAGFTSGATIGQLVTGSFGATAGYTGAATGIYPKDDTFSATAAMTPVATSIRPADVTLAATATVACVATGTLQVQDALSATAAFEATAAAALSDASAFAATAAFSASATKGGSAPAGSCSIFLMGL